MYQRFIQDILANRSILVEISILVWGKYFLSQERGNSSLLLNQIFL